MDRLLSKLETDEEDLVVEVVVPRDDGVTAEVEVSGSEDKTDDDRATKYEEMVDVGEAIVEERVTVVKVEAARDEEVEAALVQVPNAGWQALWQ